MPPGGLEVRLGCEPLGPGRWAPPRLHVALLGHVEPRGQGEALLLAEPEGFLQLQER